MTYGTGYQPKDGTRIDLRTYTHFDRYRLALESMVRMLDPNLKYPVIGDTDYKDGLKPIHADALPHYGHRYAGLLERLSGPLAKPVTSAHFGTEIPLRVDDDIAAPPHRSLSRLAGRRVAQRRPERPYRILLQRQRCGRT